MQTDYVLAQWWNIVEIVEQQQQQQLSKIFREC